MTIANDDSFDGSMNVYSILSWGAEQNPTQPSENNEK